MQNNVEYLFRQNVHSSMGSQHPPSATLTLNKIGLSKNKYLHSLFDPRDINDDEIRSLPAGIISTLPGAFKPFFS